MIDTVIKISPFLFCKFKICCNLHVIKHAIMGKKIVILFFPSAIPDSYDSSYPWALLFLERVIRHLNIEIILLDERIDTNYPEIINNVKERILFVGVSAILGNQVTGGVKFSETVRSITKVPIIWGGWFPAFYPEMLLNEGTADYLCMGQGEIPFKAFTERMYNGEDVSDIPGIGFKKNGNIILNTNPSFVNPDTFPPIDRTLIDPNKLIDIRGPVKPEFRVFTYLLSVGCPNNCSFCCEPLVYGNKWFSKKLPEIIEDLRYYIKKASISQINFWDDNFFAKKIFVLDFCKEIISSGLSFTWAAHAHVGNFLHNFSDEDIDLMYKSGLRRIVMGIESGDQDVLNLINKKVKVEENLLMIKICKKHNIIPRFHTMICFPYDPDRDLWNTIKFIGKAILINSRAEAIIRFYYPIPKTPLGQLCIEKGFKIPQTTTKLITGFSNKMEAPWYKQDYYKVLDNFVNFYFLMANPHFYKTFTLKKRPFVFLLNMIMFPFIILRFKFNLLKFPIEAKLFKDFIKEKKGFANMSIFTVNKTRIIKNS